MTDPMDTTCSGHSEQFCLEFNMAFTEERLSSGRGKQYVTNTSARVSLSHGTHGTRSKVWKLYESWNDDGQTPGGEGERGLTGNFSLSCKLIFSMNLFCIKRAGCVQSQPLFGSNVLGDVDFLVSKQQGYPRLLSTNNKSHSVMLGVRCGPQDPTRLGLQPA